MTNINLDVAFNSASDECLFYMTHPALNVLVPASATDMRLLPLRDFFKRTYYRLPDGSFERSGKVTVKAPELLDKFHDDLMEFLA